MTVAEAGARAMIQQFGEEITVYPHSEQSPTDVEDPVFFEQSSTEPESFTEKVRVYASPSKETMEEYGFDEDTDSIIYNTNDSIEEGDKVEIFGNEFIVRRQVTNQIGDGPYIWVYNLVGV